MIKFLNRYCFSKIIINKLDLDYKFQKGGGNGG